MKRIAIATLLIVVAIACSNTAEPDSSVATSTTEAITPNAAVTYTVREIANVEGAVDSVERDDEDNWIYIVGRNGIVERWNRSSNTRIDQVLDMTSFTTGEGERGLLGLAFRQRNDTWTAFVNYTNRDGDTVIAAFAVRADGTFDTSSPSARSRTAAIKVFTTSRATSASSRAFLISLSVASMSAADSFPLARRPLNVSTKRSERFPNTSSHLLTQ
jgi:hypothetical protein